jgi:hypothetical protein
MPIRLTPRTLLALLGVAALSATFAIQAARPSPARANPKQRSIMMDDAELVYGSDALREKTLNAMSHLGVDTVRVTMLWKVVARHAHRHHRHFRGNDPSTYPRHAWDRYDRLVEGAAARGIQVYFNITGPGPRWAMHRAPTKRLRHFHSYKPSVGRFKNFVRAAGKRYDGHHTDVLGHPIPRVSIWSIWNEPNSPGWLTPQWVRRGHHKIPYAPILYRRLYHAGHDGLVGTGHGGDQILIGETAPLGNTRARTYATPVAARLFIERMLCVTRGGHAYRGRKAKLYHCRHFSPLKATGYAHHPYTKYKAPTEQTNKKDAITLANLPDLPQILDRAAKNTGHIKAGLPIWVTEYGYETNPPDPFHGISLEKQAKYINYGNYLAYHDPRVVSVAQLLLRDAPLVRHTPKHSKARYANYQSGLLFHDGKPKPSLQAYLLPFVAAPLANGTYEMWGQLRFRPDGRPDAVLVQFQPQGGQAWFTEATTTTDGGRGFFDVNVPAAGPGAWRACWPGTTPVCSRTAPVKH